eukprot:7111492-Alexandrium_andersonii.AAC.1
MAPPHGQVSAWKPCSSNGAAHTLLSARRLAQVPAGHPTALCTGSRAAIDKVALSRTMSSPSGSCRKAPAPGPAA